MYADKDIDTASGGDKNDDDGNEYHAEVATVNHTVQAIQYVNGRIVSRVWGGGGWAQWRNFNHNLGRCIVGSGSVGSGTNNDG